jgi:hypothetical protein
MTPRATSPIVGQSCMTWPFAPARHKPIAPHAVCALDASMHITVSQRSRLMLNLRINRDRITAQDGGARRCEVPDFEAE